MIRPLFACVLALASCAPAHDAKSVLQCNTLDLDAEYGAALIRECKGKGLSECPAYSDLHDAYIDAVVERCGQ